MRPGLNKHTKGQYAHSIIKFWYPQVKTGITVVVSLVELSIVGRRTKYFHRHLIINHPITLIRITTTLITA